MLARAVSWKPASGPSPVDASSQGTPSARGCRSCPGWPQLTVTRSAGSRPNSAAQPSSAAASSVGCQGADASSGPTSSSRSPDRAATVCPAASTAVTCHPPAGPSSRSARTCTAPRTSVPATVSVPNPAGSIRRCGTHACSMCITASFSPGLPSTSAASGPDAPSSAEPANQGRSSAPRTRAEHDRELTSGRKATRRNGPAWKNSGPYRSVPSTIPAAEATVSRSPGPACGAGRRRGWRRRGWLRRGLEREERPEMIDLETVVGAAQHGLYRVRVAQRADPQGGFPVAGEQHQGRVHPGPGQLPQRAASQHRGRLGHRLQRDGQRQHHEAVDLVIGQVRVGPGGDSRVRDQFRARVVHPRRLQEPAADLGGPVQACLGGRCPGSRCPGTRCFGVRRSCGGQAGGGPVQAAVHRDPARRVTVGEQVQQQPSSAAIARAGRDWVSSPGQGQSACRIRQPGRLGRSRRACSASAEAARAGAQFRAAPYRARTVPSVTRTRSPAALTAPSTLLSPSACLAICAPRSSPDRPAHSRSGPVPAACTIAVTGPIRCSTLEIAVSASSGSQRSAGT